MKAKTLRQSLARALVFACVARARSEAADTSGSSSKVPPVEPRTEFREQTWTYHVQKTAIVQGDPGFPAKYSVPNSLNSSGEIRETVSLDLFAGARLWRGAEARVDGLMWQG